MQLWLLEEEDVLKLILKIREFTDAGIILNHMYLFDEIEKMIKDDN